MTKKILQSIGKIPIVKYFYDKMGIAELRETKRIAHIQSLPQEAYSVELKKIFKVSTGRDLNLENPQTFDEKIQWLILHDRSPLKTRLADKYLVREWVSEKIGEDYLIPLLGVWDSFDEIDFDILPNQFVLKTNHGSGQNIIVRDKSDFDKRTAKKLFEVWLSKPYGISGLELHYFDIPRKIIAEKYVENNGGNLIDYKVHCFHGKAYFIQYIGDRVNHQTHEGWFDRDWNLLPFTDGCYPRYEHAIPKPHELDKLLQLCEILSQPFIYVRVDFYVLNDGSFKFGEMTFTPAAGRHKWESYDDNKSPEDWDKYLGSLLNLSINKNLS